MINEVQKCIITNVKQLTSFRLFDVGLLCLYGYDGTERRHDMLFSNYGVTGTVETGHLAFVLVLTLVMLNVPDHDQMQPTGP